MGGKLFYFFIFLGGGDDIYKGCMIKRNRNLQKDIEITRLIVVVSDRPHQ